MSWTLIAKPGAQNWTDEHPQGKEQYDESTIEYDSAGTFYDGINPMQWTDVAKPTSRVVIQAGMATGLITPPTYSRAITAESWVRVPKPNQP